MGADSTVRDSFDARFAAVALHAEAGDPVAKQEVLRVTRDFKKRVREQSDKVNAAARRVKDFGPSYWFREGRRSDDASYEESQSAVRVFLEEAFEFCCRMRQLQTVSAFTGCDLRIITSPVVTGADLATATGHGDDPAVQECMAKASAAVDLLWRAAWTERTAGDVLCALGDALGFLPGDETQQ